MSNLKIRQYRSSDKSIAWQLHKIGLAKKIRVPSRSNPLDQDFNDIEKNYLKNGDFLVGEVNGQVVAMGAFKMLDKQTAELKRMRVHPDFQRKGYGKAILKELEKRAEWMGYKKMVLHTGEKLIKAQRFYETNGYKKKGKGIVDIYNVIWYEKDLSN